MSILVGLIVILALAPLPFGSTPIFWQSTLAAASLTLGAWAVIAERRALTWPPSRQPLLAWAMGMFCLTLIWAVIQGTIPNIGAHPAWRQIEDTLGGPVTSTISLDPFASIADAMSLAGIGVVFLVSLLVAQDPRNARHLLVAIASIVALYSVYGIIVYTTGNDTVAWADKRHYLGSLTSTFVNRNSFGIFAGLGALAAVALLMTRVFAILGSQISGRDRLRLLLESLASRTWAWLIATLACIMALLLTGSRGATAATTLGLITLLAIYFTTRRADARAVTAVVLLGVIAAVLLLSFSGDFLLERVEDQLSEGLGDRAGIFANAVATLQDHLWLGAGYGAFADAYAIYGSGDGGFTRRIEAAHNVYLEMAIELGLPMALVFFASVGLLVFTCIRGIYTRRRDRIFTITAVAATVIVGVQGLVDFGVQTPAIASLYAALLGMGVAQSTSSRKSRG